MSEGDLRAAVDEAEDQLAAARAKLIDHQLALPGRRALLLLGCARSGTTILSEAFPEMTLEPAVEDPCRSALEPHEYLSAKLPHNDVSKTPPGLLINLARFRETWNVELLDVVWLVRDPYDNAVSLREPIQQSLFADVLYRGDEPWWGKAARYWVETHTLGRAHAVAEADRVVEVRYEDVVLDPWHLRDLFGVLGLRTGDRFDEWTRKVSRERGVREADFQKGWNAKAPTSAGPHLGRLDGDPDRAKIVEAFAPHAELIEALGYEVIE